jgi:hypothetical protein
MDILRSIEKNVLNVANNNGKSNEVDILKKNIKEYFGHLADKENIDSQKKEKYFNKYENARVIANMEYDKFLRDKETLMNELKIEKSKAALHEYLKLKYVANNVPDIYSYQDIRLVDRVIIPREIVKKPTKKKAKAKAEDVKTPKPVKVPNVVKPPKPVKVPNVVKTPKANECPEGKEINPITGRCVNKCKDDEERNQETGKCKKIAMKALVPVQLPVPVPLDIPEPSQVPIPAPLTVKAPAKEKPVKAVKVPKVVKPIECPEGKEISPLTGRCVNKCKDDEERNLETGKCKKKKNK